MKRVVRGIIYLLCGLQFSVISAQDFSVQATIDSTFLFIGEQTAITFEVDQLADEKINVPLFLDTIISGIELVERLKIDTIQIGNNRMKIKHSFLVTSFDTALYYIPPFDFFNDKGDTVESNPLSLKVFTVEISSDSTEFQIADIKPIYVPPFNWKRFFLILLYVLLGVLVSYGIYRLVLIYLRNKYNILKEPEVIIPAHITALEELDKIKEKKIWQQGKYKAYYTELTDVIRVYISKRYDVNAMESTSDETLSMLKDFEIEKTTISLLMSIFQLADLVKFAKWNPLQDECSKSLSEAYSFVNQTKEIEQIQENDDLEEKETN